MKMLAGQVVGPCDLRMIEAPIPEIGDGQILVKLEAGALCGSDLPYYELDRRHPALQYVTPPLPVGYSLHECVGIVAQSRTGRYREGDRVLALPFGQSGLAEYFASEPDAAVPVPPGPADLLVVAQPLGTVVHAVLKLGNLVGQTAVVVGQGPIGQLFNATLMQMGVRQLIAADLLSERLEVSRRMGATHVVNSGEADLRAVVAELTGGRGADLVVEAVGEEDALDLCTDLIRRNGTLLAFGVPHEPVYRLRFGEFFRREGRLVCSVGPNVQHDFPIAVDWIASGRLDVSPIVTHRMPLAEAPAAFEMFAQRRDGAIKVVLQSS